MRRSIALSISILVVLAATAFALQQSYPNQPDMETILDNDKVVVQRVNFPAGTWQGEHSHGGNQLAVAITEVTQIVKKDGKETSNTLKPGEILWVEKGSHDHKMVKSGTAVLITVK